MLSVSLLFDMHILLHVFQEQDESALAPAQSSAVDSSSDSSNVADVFSSMLKDTTSEHRTHLFDLNCKICTGNKKDGSAVEPTMSSVTICI